MRGRCRSSVGDWASAGRQRLEQRFTVPRMVDRGRASTRRRRSRREPARVRRGAHGHADHRVRPAPGRRSRAFLRARDALPSGETRVFVVGRRLEEHGPLSAGMRLCRDGTGLLRELGGAERGVLIVNPSLDAKSLLRDGLAVQAAKARGRQVIVFVRGWQDDTERALDGRFGTRIRLVLLRRGRLHRAGEQVPHGVSALGIPRAGPHGDDGGGGRRAEQPWTPARPSSATTGRCTCSSSPGSSSTRACTRRSRPCGWSRDAASSFA